MAGVPGFQRPPGMLQTTAGKAGMGRWLWLVSLGDQGLSSGRGSWTLRGLALGLAVQRRGWTADWSASVGVPAGWGPGACTQRSETGHREEATREPCRRFPGEPATWPAGPGTRETLCPSARSWPPRERQPCPGGCYLTILLAWGSPLWGHLPSDRRHCGPRGTEREDNVAVDGGHPGVGGGRLEPGLASGGLTMARGWGCSAL